MTDIPKTALTASRFLEASFVASYNLSHEAYNERNLPEGIVERTDSLISGLVSSVDALQPQSREDERYMDALRIAGRQALNDCLHLAIPAVSLLDMEGVDKKLRLDFMLRSVVLPMCLSSLPDVKKNDFLKRKRYEFVDEGQILRAQSIGWQRDVISYFREQRKKNTAAGCPARYIPAVSLGNGMLVGAMWKSFCKIAAYPELAVDQSF